MRVKVRKNSWWFGGFCLRSARVPRKDWDLLFGAWGSWSAKDRRLKCPCPWLHSWMRCITSIGSTATMDHWPLRVWELCILKTIVPNGLVTHPEPYILLQLAQKLSSGLSSQMFFGWVRTSWKDSEQWRIRKESHWWTTSGRFRSWMAGKSNWTNEIQKYLSYSIQGCIFWYVSHHSVVSWLWYVPYQCTIRPLPECMKGFIQYPCDPLSYDSERLLLGCCSKYSRQMSYKLQFYSRSCWK